VGKAENQCGKGEENRGKPKTGTESGRINRQRQPPKWQSDFLKFH